MISRRTRAAASKAVPTSTVITAKTTMDDQYFASPKRKDCKLDTNNIAIGNKTLKSSVTPVSPKRVMNNKNTGAKTKKSSVAITKFFHVENGKADNHNNNHENNKNNNNSNHDHNETNGINGSLEESSLLSSKNTLTQRKKPMKSDNMANDSLSNSDSNSCDSGVVPDNAIVLASPAAKLCQNESAVKQTTPHRIVCPSSPTKKHRQYAKSATAGISSLNIDDGSPRHKTSGKIATRQDQKPKRRLNVNETENVLKASISESTVISSVSISGESSVLTESSSSSEQTVKIVESPVKTNKKTVLNSTTVPTAHQNTTNNNKPRSQHMHSTQLTDFFPIRRSVRKTKKAVEQEYLRHIEIAIEKQIEDGLVVKIFKDKGRGIVAGRPFARGEFVVEYIGELIEQAEADRREEAYSKNVDFGCYMYYFKYKEQQWCIDATEETGKLGRLVNHSRNGNLLTKIVSYKNSPHLVLLAKDDIKEGEELTYDYGDRRREALLHHPWLAY